jgi:serine protease Do
VVGLIKPGTKVPVEVIRDRKLKTLRLKVGGLASDEKASMAAGNGVSGNNGRLGLLVSEIDEQQQGRWGISGGVVVSETMPGKVADRAGIRGGDIITLIDGKPISSIAAYERAVDKLEPGKSVPLRLIRRGSPLFIGLKIE